MAIGAITMLLTNVGLQIYNNWCGCRQNDKLQKKREEFERAARDRNTEHMWKLLREGQELTLELEQQKHGDRLKELKKEVDDLLRKLTYEATINNWPLKVLPIVMKNQAFGNLLAKQEENVAMHVIFTRSNYDNFNKLIYPIVEKKLEQYCDKHWSTMTDHPVLFYSGAWKPMSSPTDVQVTAMREELKNLPTLLITPFFRPNDGKLVFQVHMWGVGANSTDRFDVPEIEPLDFQRSFSNNDDYDNERGLFEEIVEDLVPYLECMIGYMADTYFWSSAGLAPHLPMLVTNGSINTDGMKYIVDDCREYYDKLLLKSEENAKENPFMQQNLLKLYEGSAELWDEETKIGNLKQTFLTYCCQRKGQNVSDMFTALAPTNFSKEDIPFIDTSLNHFRGTEYESKLRHIKEVLTSINFDYNLLSVTDIDFLEEKHKEGKSIASYRLGEIYEYSIGTKWDKALSNQYYLDAERSAFILARLRNNIDLYEQYREEIDCLINAGVAQAFVFKACWLYTRNMNAEALQLLSSTSSSHPAILFKKAKILIETNCDVSQAEEILTNLAAKGYIKAQELLCEMYKKGDVLNENPSKHAEYAEKAMMQNSPDATYAMALCYLHGYGVQQSSSTGIMLVDRAEELGCMEAKRIKSLLNSI